MKVFCANNIKSLINTTSSLAVKSKGITNDKCFIFCEEKVTLLHELDIAQKFGGFFNIRVLTFKKYILEKNKNVKTLSKESSVMCIRKIISDNEKKLVCFKNAQSLTNLSLTIYEIISQLKSAKVSSCELISIVSNNGINNLSIALLNKIKDISLIYNEYEQYLKTNNLFDNYDYLSTMVDIIKSDEELKNSTVIFSGFLTITKQKAEIIKTILNYAKETYSVVINDKNSHIFTGEVLNCLKNIDKNLEVINVDSDFGIENKLMLENLYNPKVFASSFKKYATDKIFINEYSDIETEVEESAKLIKKGVKSGKRYSDFSLGIGSLETYLPLVISKFEEYKIPYYVDRTSNLLEHPLSNLILNYIEMCRKGLSKNEVFNFINTFFIAPSSKERDEFYNYCLKYSVNRKGFLSRFDKQDDIEKIESIRQIVETSYKFLEGKKMVKEYVQAINDMLNLINTKEKLNLFGEKLKGYKEEKFYDFNSKVYAKINDVLNEILEISKDVKMSLIDFKNILTSGFLSTEVGAIPLYNDAVYVGEVKEVKINSSNVLILIGINGDVPFTKSDTALLTDNDLNRLDGLDIIIEPKIKLVNRRERENVCLAITSFTNKLYISYSSAVNGKVAFKGDIIKYLLAIFDIKIINDNEKNILIKTSTGGEIYYKDSFYSETSSLKQIAGLKKDYINKNETARKTISSFINVLSETNNKELLEKTESILEDKESKQNVSSGALQNQDNRISATAIESYFKCPYNSFCEKLLKLKCQEVSDMEVTDIGVIYHYVVEKYVKDIERVKDKITSDMFVEELLNELMLTDNYVRFAENVKYNFLKEFIYKECKNLCYNVYLGVVNSNFKPYLIEEAFGDGEKYESIKLNSKCGQFKVSGRVDRVDRCGDYIRIIDYKTGKIEPSINELYAGKKLQLYLYMNAFLKDNLQPAGAYYYSLKDDYSLSVLGEEKEKYTKMDGYTLKDNKVIDNTDIDIDNLKESRFVKVTKTKEGEISKKSSTIEENELKSLLEYSKLVAEQGIDEINMGYIKPSPYKDSCKYCNYMGLCGYNADKDGERVVKNVTNSIIVDAVKESKGESNE